MENKTNENEYCQDKEPVACNISVIESEMCSDFMVKNREISCTGFTEKAVYDLFVKVTDRIKGDDVRCGINKNGNKENQ